MPAIYVCPKSQVPDVAERLRPSHLITLLDPADHMPTPDGIAGDRHLRLGMNDIVQVLPDHTPPDEQHVREIIAFAQSWDRTRPMLIHCWAGISRSTASAFTAMCLYNPDVDELKLAQQLRSLSHVATPNRRIVAFADDIMGRQGRMVDAVDAIGRGEDAFEGVIFQWKV